jgi:hypothetical protein
MRLTAFGIWLVPRHAFPHFLIDREVPWLQAKLDELTKLSIPATLLTASQKQEFIDATNRLKLLTDRRALLLARIGDEYIADPPKLAAKP